MKCGVRIMTREEEALLEDRALIAFWDRAFTAAEKEEERDGKEADWRALAPSDKLFRAAALMGQCENVLDFGCGSGWAGIIAAKSGCGHVTAADAAPGAVRAARENAGRFGVTDRVRAVTVSAGWLESVPSGTYDGLFCSNVLDVIPPETAGAVIRETSRVTMRGAAVIVGLNYYLSPEAAAARGLQLIDGERLYMDGVLRLVSRTDEKWAQIFSPWYTVEKLEHFAWPGETEERRRLFRLRKRDA